MRKKDSTPHGVTHRFLKAELGTTVTLDDQLVALNRAALLIDATLHTTW